VKIIIKKVKEKEYGIEWEHMYINIVDDEYVDDVLDDLKSYEDPNCIYDYEVKEFENDFLICTRMVK